MKINNLVEILVTLDISLFGDESQTVDDFLKSLGLKTFRDLFDMYFYKLETECCLTGEQDYDRLFVDIRCDNIDQINEASAIVCSYKRLMQRKFNLSLIEAIYNDSLNKNRYSDVYVRYFKMHKNKIIKL